MVIYLYNIFVYLHIYIIYLYKSYFELVTDSNFVSSSVTDLREYDNWGRGVPMNITLSRCCFVGLFMNRSLFISIIQKEDVAIAHADCLCQLTPTLRIRASSCYCLFVCFSFFFLSED